MDKIIKNTPESGQTTLTDSPFYWLEKDGVRVLTAKSLEEAGFANGFSTRLGGVSPFPENDLNLAGFGEDSDENIEENRRRFLKVFDGNYRLTTVWQIHSASVKAINSEDDIKTTEDEADGLVSNLEGILLGVKTADCVPVLIGDPVTGSFAAVHAGWRGTVESIVPKAISKMTAEYGSKPDELIAAIGPAAGCERYEIGKEVIEVFAQNFSTSGNLFKETRPGHALIDLQRANSEQLAGAGVNPSNIAIAPYCTMERNDLFFSYRVEKKKHGKTGRLLSVIGKKY